MEEDLKKKLLPEWERERWALEEREIFCKVICLLKGFEHIFYVQIMQKDVTFRLYKKRESWKKVVPTKKKTL
jgi:hypothetical protein